MKKILSTNYIIEMKLSKYFTMQNLLILLVVLVLAYSLYTYSGSKTMLFEGQEDGTPEMKQTEEPKMVEETAGYATKPVASAVDLLPNDENSKWGELNEGLNSGGVQSADLLEAGHHIGLDSVAQTNKIANLQIRSDPFVEKVNVGPWNNSTIDAKQPRIGFELTP